MTKSDIFVPQVAASGKKTVRREGFDIQTDSETSARMARVRQSGTSPELVVRRIVSALGHRYRLSNRDLPGSPDLANRTRKWAIFVHGCFWHRHPGCSKATTPKRNREFWEAKFERNMKRDKRTQDALRALGYSILVIWECQTDDVDRLARRISKRIPNTQPGWAR